MQGNLWISWKLSALNSKTQGTKQLFTDRYRIGNRAPCQMLFMSGKHEFRDFFYSITGPHQPVAVWLSVPRNYKKLLIQTYSHMWENEHVPWNARAKKGFQWAPQMSWALGQWSIWPTGESGAEYLKQLVKANEISDPATPRTGHSKYFVNYIFWSSKTYCACFW